MLECPPCEERLHGHHHYKTTTSALPTLQVSYPFYVRDTICGTDAAWEWGTYIGHYALDPGAHRQRHGALYWCAYD